MNESPIEKRQFLHDNYAQMVNHQTGDFLE